LLLTLAIRFGVTSKFWDYVWGTQLEYVKPVKSS